MGGPRQLGQGHQPERGGDAGQGQDRGEWMSHGSALPAEETGKPQPGVAVLVEVPGPRGSPVLVFKPAALGLAVAQLTHQPEGWPACADQHLKLGRLC